MSLQYSSQRREHESAHLEVLKQYSVARDELKESRILQQDTSYLQKQLKGKTGEYESLMQEIEASYQSQIAESSKQHQEKVKQLKDKLAQRSLSLKESQEQVRLSE